MRRPDGSAKTREVKLVLVWRAETTDFEGHPVRDPGSVSYSAAIESAASPDTDPHPAAFAQRMRREAERRGFTLARRRVILGDGAQWIWRTAGEGYPNAIQIVDLWHAKEHLWQAARALCDGNPAQVKAWAHARCDDLEQGRLDGLLATLRAHAGTCEPAGKCADYIEKNRGRMRYPDFRAQGLCVGSGIVESLTSEHVINFACHDFGGIWSGAGPTVGSGIGIDSRSPAVFTPFCRVFGRPAGKDDTDWECVAGLKVKLTRSRRRLGDS